MRKDNGLDFWRGCAIITIYINHMHGNYWEAWVRRPWSISDYSEVFVFLSGWVFYYAVAAGRDSRGSDLISAILRRVFELYQLHLATTLCAILIIFGGVAVGVPDALHDMLGTRRLIDQPVQMIFGLLLLQENIFYFGILPLFIVLSLIFAPVIVYLYKRCPQAILPLSLAVYLATHLLDLRLWKMSGTELIPFNPLCWQLVFVLGFVMASPTGTGGFVRANLHMIRMLSYVFVLAVGFVLVGRFWSVEPDGLWPTMMFDLSKTHTSPLRIVHLLAMVAIMVPFYAFLSRHWAGACRLCCQIGRHGLIMVCVSSPLALLGLVLRARLGENVVLDSFLVVVGVAVLWQLGKRLDARYDASRRMHRTPVTGASAPSTSAAATAP